MYILGQEVTESTEKRKPNQNRSFFVKYRPKPNRVCAHGNRHNTNFNLINTGVVNCLIICQNARKMHNSEAKNPKTFGDTTSPNPIPSGHLDIDLAPQTKILDPPVADVHCSQTHCFTDWLVIYYWHILLV